MQQIEHGVLLAAGLVAGRGVDRHTTGETCRRTLVPHLAHGAVGHLVHLVKVCTGITTNEQHAEQVVDVADVVDVQGIDGLHAVHDHVISIELGLQGLGGEAPHAIVVLHEIHHARSVVGIATELDLLRRKEVTSDLHLLCLRGNDVEGDGIVSIHDGRSHLRALSPAEVLLSLCCQA